MWRRRWRDGAVLVVVLVAVGTGAATVVAGEQGSTTTPASNSPGNATGNVTSDGTVEVVLFYLPGCPHCDRVESYLHEQRDDYEFTVRAYNARQRPQLFARYLQAYDVPRERWGPVPVVFVGDEYAIGDRPAIELLEATFERAAATTDPAGIGDVGTVTLLSLAGLALTDAINPCALAVLVVLLTTVLSRDPENPRRVLAAGLAFALAVGLTYAVIGALLVFGFKSLGTAAGGEIVWAREALGVLAIAIGLLNLKDGVGHGAGGFAMEVPERWRPAMQRYLTGPLWSRRRIVVGAGLAGVGVSLFLVPCTAGPYVVAGGILAEVSWQGALPLLVAYNVVFVLPMIAITGVVAGGFASADAIGDWRATHRRTLHLAAGGVLVALGVAMVLGYL